MQSVTLFPFVSLAQAPLVASVSVAFSPFSLSQLSFHLLFLSTFGMTEITPETESDVRRRGYKQNFLIT